MTREEEVLSNLTYAWVNWDYDDFIEKFFKHRFSVDFDFHRSADSYAKENWTTFSKNPVRYMNSMDLETLSVFTKAITGEIK